MTVEIYPTPGSFLSTKFTATVGGSPATVLGHTMATGMPTVAWTLGQSVELSWLVFGTDATTEVRITRLAGAITSYEIYPENSGHTASISAGVLVISMPANVRLHCELNTDRANVIILASSPLKTLPVAYTNWTAVAKPAITAVNTGGTGVITTASAHGLVNNQPMRIRSTGSYPVPAAGAAITDNDVLYATFVDAVNITVSRTLGGATMLFSNAGASSSVQRADWTDTVNALYFGAGVHYPGRLFQPAAGTTIYVDGGAVIVGSFDLRNKQNISIKGPGNIAGTYATRATVIALPDFYDQVTYAVFLGYDGSQFTYNNTVSGVTVFAYPFYTTFEGLKTWTNVQLINPWNYNCDGFDCSDGGAGDDGYVTDCYGFVGDDAIRAESQWFSLTATNVFTVTSNAGSVLFSYFGSTITGKTQYITNCHGMSLSLADGDGDPNNVTTGADAIFKSWTDTTFANRSRGFANAVVTNYHVWGPMESRLFAIQNIPYPTASEANDACGNIEGITFDGLTVQEVPEQIAIIRGLDWLNSPHDITFTDLTIDGLAITSRNFSEFVSTNNYPYNIFVGGTPVVNVVDLVNIALSHIGEGITVTSISPPDDSAAAIAASRFLTMAISETLGSIAWPFATTRAALVEATTNDHEDTQGYCYELPSDCVRVLGLLPEGAKDDFLLTDGTPVGFQTEVSDDSVERIYTDLEDAQIRYTKYIDDPNKWSPQFQYAFTWMMAAMLCGPVIKGATGVAMRNDCMQKALAFIQAAANDSSTKRNVRPNHVPAWLSRSGILPDARIIRP